MFNPGECVIVKEIDGVPEEWRGRKGMVTVVSGTGDTIGIQAMEQIPNPRMSNYQVLLNETSKSKIIPEWMLEPCQKEPAMKQ